MYPTGSEFLESVSTEIRQQVRRLQHHPSLLLWAGNNENEAALRGNWYVEIIPVSMSLSHKILIRSSRLLLLYACYNIIQVWYQQRL